MTDLELLRQYEPVLIFNRGENFYPTSIEQYVRHGSLWLRADKSVEQCLVPLGQLSLERLAEYKEVPLGQNLYVRLAEEPLDVIEYRRWRKRPGHPTFRATGRLARVGLLSRLAVDIFSLSLLLRGNVPGGTAGAAGIKYEQILQYEPSPIYYGRIRREAGWIILQYVFFYVMNDWRSGFYGVNDHEADFEQVFIYLSEEVDAPPEPRWAAYASHDYTGADLRRRWDDPELQRAGDHPIVYVGAGSHCSYFLPGEYLMVVEPAILRPLRRALQAFDRFWQQTLGQGDVTAQSNDEVVRLSLPFIDYARGDGLAIGPGAPQEWVPVLLDGDEPWLTDYRGLWGLDTRDVLGGERAPAGPKFERDGSVRVSWYDPLGWAGMDEVPPPGQVTTRLRQQMASVSARRQEAAIQIKQRREALRQLALEVSALEAANHLSKLYKEKELELVQARQDLRMLYARHTRLDETLLSTRAYLSEVEAGSMGEPQAHLRQKHLPMPPLSRRSWLAEVWAAFSGGALLLALVALLLFHPSRWYIWLAGGVLVFLVIEAVMRGRLVNFLISLTILLGVITAFVLLVEFFAWFLIAVLAALVVHSVVINLRELRGR